MNRQRKLFLALVLFLIVMMPLMYNSLAFPHYLHKFSRAFSSVFASRSRGQHPLPDPDSSSTALVNTPFNNQTSSQDQGPNVRNFKQLAAGGKKLLCHTLKGRLGNQLFQYASVIGLARKLGRIPVFDNSSMPILRVALQHPLPSPPRSKKRCKAAKVQSEKACCYFQKKLLELDPDKDYTVGRYLQSYKYFEGFEEEVRKAVEFKKSSQQKADQTIQDLRKTWNRTLVGVHVRQGDYLKPHFAISGYLSPPASYFQQAMAYMRKRLGNVTFVVSVEKKKWFQALAGNAKDVVFLKQQEAQTDMAVLSSTDHVITSVGTYSWWIGYLCRGVVTYWKGFIKPGTVIGNKFHPDGSTFIYPGWIPL